MKKQLQHFRLGIILCLAFCMKQALGACGNPSPTTSITSLGFQKYSFNCVYVPYSGVKWLYGNGATGNGWNTNYTYPTEGKYIVKVVMTDSAKKCTDTFVVDTLCAITSNYFASKATGVYRYLFISANKDTSHRRFIWDYGNGHSGGSSYTYYKYGFKSNYTTSLTVYDSVLGCSSKTTISVKVKRCNGIDTFKLTPNCTADRSATLSYTNGTNKGNLNAEILWGDSTSDVIVGKPNTFDNAHTWTAGGTKTIYLLVADSAKCEDTLIKSIKIYDTAFNNIHFTFNAQLYGKSVNFTMTDSVSRKYFSYYDFGDGTKGYSSYISHTYAKGNTSYVACAYFISKDFPSCAPKVCKSVYVGWTKCGKATPKFNVSVYNGLAYYFTTTPQSGYKPHWIYGNGAVGYGWNLLYTYPSEGKYDVKFVLVDSTNWCTDTFLVGNYCVLDARYSIVKTGMRKYQFTANAKSTKNKAFIWDFGNSKSAVGNSATCFYTAVGTYNTKLTVFDSALNCAVTMNVYLYAYGCSGPDSFTVVNDCVTNKKATFYYHNWDTAYGLKLSAKMFWGDGSHDTMSGSMTLSKSHTWSTAGSKYMMLVVKDSSGCTDTVRRVFAIQDTAFNNLYFGFSLSQTGRDVSVSVSGSTAKNQFSKWEFGDGNSGFGNSYKYQYAAANKTYNLCAIFKSNSCTQKTCKSVTVVVPKCGAIFTKYGDTTKKFSMYVVNASYGSRVRWDFGDGDTSNNFTPKHTYAGLGPYNLCITAYDSACSSTYCDTIGFDSTGIMSRSAGFELNVVDANGNVGIKSQAMNRHLRLFPNPANDNLEIDGLQTGTTATVEIYTAEGKQIRSIKLVQSSRNTLDVSNIQSGLYFVRIVQQGYVYSAIPLLIQR